MTNPKEITINNARYILVEEKKPIIIEIKTRLEVYPHDLPGLHTFDGAQKEAAKLGDGWRVPTDEELNLICDNKANIAGLNLTGSDPDGWYWSSTPFNDYNARCQRLSYGHQSHALRSDGLPVRLVRSLVI